MNSHEYRTCLIIENDPEPDEFISSYIDRELKEPHWDIDFLTNLKSQNQQSIQQKLSENDTYIFSTTFSNKEQNQQLIEMIAHQEYPKDIFIHYLSGDLFFGLYKAIPSGFDPSSSGFKNHTIYGIHRETKIKEEGQFFKSQIHYFDTIKYYWNDELKGYFPERPNCFYNNNLNSIYKYKPMWISRDSDIKH